MLLTKRTAKAVNVLFIIYYTVSVNSGLGSLEFQFCIVNTGLSVPVSSF